MNVMDLSEILKIMPTLFNKNKQLFHELCIIKTIEMEKENIRNS